jgi:hypothetical protein
MNATYELYATWVADPGNATDAQYSVFDDTTPLGSATVNQQNAPSDVLSGGVTWQSLGTFTTTTGLLRVDLSSLADGNVDADAVFIAVPPGGPTGPSLIHRSPAPAAAAALFSSSATASPVPLVGGAAAATPKATAAPSAPSQAGAASVSDSASELAAVLVNAHHTKQAVIDSSELADPLHMHGLFAPLAGF